MSPIRTYHNAYDAHYHIVFPVEYRKALLLKDIPPAIVAIANEITQRYDIEFEKIGTDLDHIHILVSFPPKYGGSDVVRIFKSITAKQLFLQFPYLKKELWGGEFWTDGYYAGTVSQKGTLETLVTYVKKQGIKPESVQLRLL